MLPDNAASYRLQLHEGFGFDDVVAITDYLADLGITHLYLSPILQARRGSAHGYDVVDHDRLSHDLGGAEAYERLVEAWEPRSIIVDVVPNHMAVGDSTNRWWWDVLKNGTESPYAPFFDIDWDPSEAWLSRSVLVPILGDHYGRVLEAGEIQLEAGRHGTVVRYHEHVLPLAEGTEPKDISAANDDVEALHEILEAQHYRLARWTAAGHELNYRRFFAINDLAALRIDRPEVFDATHGFLLSLTGEGAVHGLRIDHIDGLRYPADYLERLAGLAPEVPIWVEKILEGDEQLPSTWPVAGSTGYDFLNRVGGLFIAPDGEKPMTDIYATFLGTEAAGLDPHLVARASKFKMMNDELATDVERLTDLFVAVCEDLPRYRDFTRPELRHALRETLASMPVYRTYADSRRGAVSDQDVATVMAAVEDARMRRRDLDPEIFDLLSTVLLLRVRGDEEEALAMRFQQTSGPVMAKGVEDTFFYIYNRLTALNEVGGDPLRFSVSVDAFHRATQRCEKHWPHTLLATSTHDTKRSEDVRARLALLSEIPDAWGATVERWARMNDHHRAGFDDRNMEYLLYQTLVGAWPLTGERAVTYMTKAAKEAKERTSWIAPDEAYDAALISFVEAVMDDGSFTSDVERFVAPLVEPGRITSLAQTLLKITCPGVSDFYQGTEIWNLSLVDPDNRRPVDYDACRRLLTEVNAMSGEEAWAAADTGAPKLFMIRRALELLSRISDASGTIGAYAPLEASGARADHVVAFARGATAIVVVPRLVISLGDQWEDTTLTLPWGRWTDVFTGTEIEGTASLEELLGRFPVALLTKDTR